MAWYRRAPVNRIAHAFMSSHDKWKYKWRVKRNHFRVRWLSENCSLFAATTRRGSSLSRACNETTFILEGNYVATNTQCQFSVWNAIMSINNCKFCRKHLSWSIQCLISMHFYTHLVCMEKLGNYIIYAIYCTRIPWHFLFLCPCIVYVILFSNFDYYSRYGKLVHPR